MRLATPLKIASAVVFGAGLATYARYRREMRQRITALPQNAIGRLQAGAAVAVSRIIVPWLHRYRAGHSYNTRPGRPSITPSCNANQSIPPDVSQGGLPMRTILLPDMNWFPCYLESYLAEPHRFSRGSSICLSC